MSIQCPYNALELKTALFLVSQKLEKYEKVHGEGSAMKKLDEATDLLVPDNKKQKELAAEYHGITVEQLVNSPNYSALTTEHAMHMMSKVRTFLTENFGFDDREGWAMVLAEQIESMSIDDIMKGRV